MEYSAGMVSCLFWLAETRKTAEYMLSGFTKDQMKQLVLAGNIYQVRSENRAKNMFCVICRRLESLTESLVQIVAKGDVSTAKLLVLIAIMKTDRLFFEFVYEIYRGRIMLGEDILTDKEIDLFFAAKASQSEIVASWSQSGIVRLKQCYTRTLYEAGLLSDSAKVRKITPVMLDYKIRKQLEECGYTVYLHAITGEN